LRIQNKLLLTTLPLLIIPVVILAAVGFISASRESEKTSARYLAQRENDLRVLADNPAIRDYYFNRYYKLEEEAALFREQIERRFREFYERANENEPVYRHLRYIAPNFDVLISYGKPKIDDKADAESIIAAVVSLSNDRLFASEPGLEMVYALPIREPRQDGSNAFLGALAVDFHYPRDEFHRTTVIIAQTFAAISIGGLMIAIPLLIIQFRWLTRPLRDLSEAADSIAAGDRLVTVDIVSRDEIGRVGQSFNRMSQSLAANEAALQRQVAENAALFEIGREITAQIHLEPTLDLIVRRAREQLDGDDSLLALDDGERQFSVHAMAGRDSKSLSSLVFHEGEGIAGRVVTHAEPALIDDYEVEGRASPFFDLVEKSGIRAFVAAPLLAREGVVGVLFVLSKTVGKFDPGDVQMLAALASQATISIENAQLYTKVERNAEELSAKVTERTHDLEEVNRQLQEASQHKSQFLANMSHELRTPLNAIIGFTRIVARKGQDVLPKRQLDNLGKILKSAEHLLGLINDILDLSKIEAGRIDIHTQTFEIHELVTLCLRTIEPVLRSDSVNLVNSVPSDLPEVHTDLNKLKQILINLLSNAAKFTEAGRIIITAETDDANLRIAVTDSGVGIPRDRLEAIFEEFQQADASTVKEYGGTGLGLAISQRLARLLGGVIEVESKEGVGSTFSVRIPMRLQNLAADTENTMQVAQGD
jgi:signal transduction histidine kinase